MSRDAKTPWAFSAAMTVAVAAVIALSCASKEHAALEAPVQVGSATQPAATIAEGAFKMQIGSATQPAMVIQQIGSPDGSFVAVPVGGVQTRIGFTAAQVAIGCAVITAMLFLFWHLPKPMEIIRILWRGKQAVKQITVEQPLPPPVGEKTVSTDL